MTTNEFDAAIGHDELLRAWLSTRFSAETVASIEFMDRREVVETEEKFYGSLAELDDGRIVKVTSAVTGDSGEGELRFEVSVQYRDARCIPFLPSEVVCDGMLEQRFGQEGYVELVQVHAIGASVRGVGIRVELEALQADETLRYIVSIPRKMYFRFPVREGAVLALLWRKGAVDQRSYVAALCTVDTTLTDRMANGWQRLEQYS